MIALVALVGLGLVALPAVSRPLGHRLRPSTWSILCLMAVTTGAALIVFAGAAISVSTVFRSVGLREVALACDAMFGHVVSAGSPAAVVVLAVSVLTIVLATRSLLRSRHVTRTVRVELGLGSRLSNFGACDVVVLDANGARAFSVPGTRRQANQIVVTRGLRDALTDEEFDLVCAHEATHLRLHHSRWLAVARAVEQALWFWPPVRSSCVVLRLAMERCADDAATGDVPERRSRLRNALVTVAFDGDRPVLAAFSTLDGLCERLVALSEPARRNDRTNWCPALLIPGLLLAGFALVELAHLGHGASCLWSITHSCATS